MKNEPAILMAATAVFIVVGMLLEKRRAAAVQALPVDPMAWITEWGKNA